MANVYFDLTRRFNASGRVAILASGQAVVYYRLAIMSKDGDWILRETEAACRRVLDVLGELGAVYRPGAPLDPAWLSGGWSSHFEFFDDQSRRVRCDFFSRPPRISRHDLDSMFAHEEADPGLPVVDLEPLIQMKRTLRAKDYAVIGELARRLPPDREIELTTDADRLLALLAGGQGASSTRPAVQAAREHGRDGAVVALAREMDLQRRQDRDRLTLYEKAAETYLPALRRAEPWAHPLARGHEIVLEIANRLLPQSVLSHPTEALP